MKRKDSVWLGTDTVNHITRKERKQSAKRNFPVE
jgi:hypothetical protein